MALSPQNAGLRERSGAVNSKDPLVSFIYHLLRDHLPAGDVEGIIQNHLAGSLADAQFCNGYIAQYARDVAARLQTVDKDLDGAEDGLDFEALIYCRQSKLLDLYAKVACAVTPGLKRGLTDAGCTYADKLVIIGCPGSDVTLNASGIEQLQWLDVHETKRPRESLKEFITRFQALVLEAWVDEVSKKAEV